MHGVRQSGLNPFVQHLFNLMRVVVVHRSRTEGVGDQIDGFMIVLDFRILAKDRRFVWIFNMFFQTNWI